jgi:hypothetical protein
MPSLISDVIYATKLADMDLVCLYGNAKGLSLTVLNSTVGKIEMGIPKARARKAQPR